MKCTMRRPGGGPTRAGRMSAWVLMGSLLGVGPIASTAVQAAEPPSFAEDFTGVAPGKVPDRFLVLDGQFSVKEEGGNRFLELAGAPLESFGAMFGPAAKEDWGAEARFFATGQGRRFPVFGVSVNGVAGYRAVVSPAKKAVEILKGDAVVASTPFVWESGSWTRVRVQLRKTGGSAWKVEAKAWKDGTPEPNAWSVSWDEAEAPVAGRAAVWGAPFSGTPIRFDDLRVRALAP